MQLDPGCYIKLKKGQSLTPQDSRVRADHYPHIERSHTLLDKHSWKNPRREEFGALRVGSTDPILIGERMTKLRRKIQM